nr:Rpn family recombination-promoting nuclease/putative transposase [Lachnospiraceae bacterium]
MTTSKIIPYASDFSDEWYHMKGPIDIPLTNDYLFRALMQTNNEALISLISSVMYWPVEEIISAEIQNEIELGAAIDDKTFILDVKVLLNHDRIVNLEMQVLNYHNWPERSLGYLCRTFDTLNSGDDYIQTKPAFQITFLDFTLFPEHPVFHAKYMLTDIM